MERTEYDINELLVVIDLAFYRGIDIKYFYT